MRGVTGYLLAGLGGLLVLLVPTLRSLWDRRQRRKAEARAAAEKRRADVAELSAGEIARVAEDRAAGAAAERAVEDVAAKAPKHKDRAAARERMRLRGRW